MQKTLEKGIFTISTREKETTKNKQQKIKVMFTVINKVTDRSSFLTNHNVVKRTTNSILGTATVYEIEEVLKTIIDGEKIKQHLGFSDYNSEETYKMVAEYYAEEMKKRFGDIEYAYLKDIKIRFIPACSNSENKHLYSLGFYSLIASEEALDKITEFYTN